MILQDLVKKNLAHPPKWLPDNCVLLMIMGSQAYGVSSDSSDQDTYGVCIPPKELVFPHLGGEIPGFGQQIQRFGDWQQHHIIDPDRNKEYDFAIYSIVKYFQLCMENNPNMVETLFSPKKCIIHMTPIGQHIIDNRHKFLHKSGFYKFRGYASAQMSKLKTTKNSSNPKRQESINKFGFDTKYAYHIIRLLLEAEQILTTGNLILDRDNNFIKPIRNGDWTLDEIDNWVKLQNEKLENLFGTSKLQNTVDESVIKNILIECLEMHYGSLDNIIVKESSNNLILADLKLLVNKYS